MIKNFKPREWKTETYYELCFDDGHGNGYGFPCDKDGNASLQYEEARKNLAYCLGHPERYARYNTVVRKENRYVEDASGVCYCGNHVRLHDQYMGACECERCGQWYNLSGQELVPPERWEENY